MIRKMNGSKQKYCLALLLVASIVLQIFSGIKVYAEDSDKPSIGIECIGFNEKTGELEWKVTVAGGEEDLTNVKVVDFFNTNEMTFKEALDAETEIKFEMPSTTIGEQIYLTGTIEQLKAGEQKEIIIKTVIENKSLENLKNGEKYSFCNKAKLTDDQDEKIAPEVEAKQDVTVSWVSQEAAKDLSEGVRRITWTVEINQHHGNLAGSTIIDKIPEGLKVIEDTLALTNSNGDKITLQNTDPSAPGYYTIIPIDESDTTDIGINITYANQLIFQIPDMEDHQSYRLTYQTELIDEKGIINVNGRAEYYNYVALEIPGMAGPYYDYESISYQAAFIGKSQEYDSKSHTIKWRVSVNSNVLHIDAGAEVVDILDDPENGLERLEIVPDSIQIRLMPNGNYMTLTQEGVTITEPGGENVNVHYELTDKGFKVVFDNAINQMYYIRYETRIKETDKDDDTANKENSYYNKAVFNAKRNGVKITKNIEAKEQVCFKSSDIRKESIDYDYNTKTVTWRITINNNETRITDAVVKDLIPTGQEYVEGSVEIKKVKKEKQGDTITEKLEDATDIVPTVGEATSTDEGKLLPVHLGDIEGTYAIIMKTKLTDNYMAELLSSSGDKEIHNSAALYGNELVNNGVSAEGTQKIESQILNKTGIQENKNEPIIWQIVVNKNQIELTDVVVTDQLTDSLKLLDEDVNNVHLYLMDVDEKGNVTQGEEVQWKDNPAYEIFYDVAAGKLEVKFLGTIQSCYQIVFKTEVTKIQPDLKYSNVAAISGKSKDIAIAEQTPGTDVIAIFDGIGEEKRGSVKVVKYDMENAVLEGAKFELIDWNGNVVSIKPTNKDGIVIFDDLRLDKEYTVKEIEAPEGYIIDEKEAYKFVLHADKEQLLHEVKNEKKTYDTDFKIVDLNGTGIQGAEFRLYNLSDLTKVVAVGKSNQEGKVILKNIPWGQYALMETSVPGGYIKSGERFTVSIAKDGSTIIKNSNQEIVTEIVNKKAANENNEIPHTNGGNNQNDTANTGDSTPIVWLFILSILSGTGLILFGKKDKKRL